MIRLQVFYSKSGAFRYTSTLEIHKTWERIFCRAGLPLAYSQGFHPQPRINQANPLPLGCSGRNELVEVWLNDETFDLRIIQPLTAALPPGIKIHQIDSVPLNSPTPQSRIIAADYQVNLPAIGSFEDLDQQIHDILNVEHLIQERRGKKYDLRPLILDLIVEQGETDKWIIRMRLVTGSQGSGRPDEVLRALNLDPFSADIERLRMVFVE